MDANALDGGINGGDVADTAASAVAQPLAVAARVRAAYERLVTSLEAVLDVSDPSKGSTAKYALSKDVAGNLEQFDDACASLRYTAERAKAVYKLPGGSSSLKRKSSDDADVRADRKRTREALRHAALGL